MISGGHDDNVETDMKTARKWTLAACLAGTLTGCSPGYALYQSQSVPGAMALRGRPAATRIDKGASALTQNYQRWAIDELRRPGSGFRFDEKSPELFLHVTTRRGMETTGMHFRRASLGTAHDFEQTDMVTVELSMRKPDGTVIWDGQILGDARYLTGTKAPKCLRVLFDMYGYNEAGEESCYR